jgi:hypothetical protein
MCKEIGTGSQILFKGMGANLNHTLYNKDELWVGSSIKKLVYQIRNAECACLR